MITTTTILPAIANLALGLIAIPFYIRLAKKRNIVDTPNHRSSHKTPTPRGGGIFIAIGSLISIIATAFIVSGLSRMAWTLFASSALVAIIGFTDDLKPLPSPIRLSGHFFAATLLITGTYFFAGGNAASTLAQPLLVGALAALAIWIVGCLNIYNFMDGIDGIATGQGLSAAGAWLAISLYSSTPVAATLAASLFGGLLAFLFFNWSPAKVFMGDGASGFLGFSFATLPILVAEPTPTDLWLKLNLGALVLFPFLFDGTFTLCRRAHAILMEDGRLKISRFPKLVELTQAHRSHLYQRWVQAGASHRTAALVYTAWAALCGLVAVAAHLSVIRLPVAWLVACAPAIALLRHSRRFPK